MDQELKGITAEELAAKEKEKLDVKAASLLQDRKKIIGSIEVFKKQLAQIETDLKDYRIASTNRVLEFIRSGVGKLDPCTILTLITHCMNKLNGNIDGRELDLKYNPITPKKEG